MRDCVLEVWCLSFQFSFTHYVIRSIEAVLEAPVGNALITFYTLLFHLEALLPQNHRLVCVTKWLISFARWWLHGCYGVLKGTPALFVGLSQPAFVCVCVKRHQPQHKYCSNSKSTSSQEQSK